MRSRMLAREPASWEAVDLCTLLSDSSHPMAAGDKASEALRALEPRSFSRGGLISLRQSSAVESNRREIFNSRRENHHREAEQYPTRPRSEEQHRF